jgi:hypothetical protein
MLDYPFSIHVSKNAISRARYIHILLVFFFSVVRYLCRSLKFNTIKFDFGISRSRIEDFSSCTFEMIGSDFSFPRLISALSIYLYHFIYLSIYLSVYLYVYRSIPLSIYLSLYLSINLSITLSIYHSIYHSIYPTLYLSINLSIYLSIILEE